MSLSSQLTGWDEKSWWMKFGFSTIWSTPTCFASTTGMRHATICGSFSSTAQVATYLSCLKMTRNCRSRPSKSLHTNWLKACPTCTKTASSSPIWSQEMCLSTSFRSWNLLISDCRERYLILSPVTRMVRKSKRGLINLVVSTTWPLNYSKMTVSSLSTPTSGLLVLSCTRWHTDRCHSTSLRSSASSRQSLRSLSRNYPTFPRISTTS